MENEIIKTLLESNEKAARRADQRFSELLVLYIVTVFSFLLYLSFGIDESQITLKTYDTVESSVSQKAK